MRALVAACVHAADLVDHVHAEHDLAEHGVAVAVARFGASRKALSLTLMKNCDVAEFGIAGARHRHACPRRCSRPLPAFQRRSARASASRFMSGVMPPPWIMKFVDHAMEHRAVVVPVLDVLQEVLDRLRRLVAASSSITMSPGWWRASPSGRALRTAECPPQEAPRQSQRQQAVSQGHLEHSFGHQCGGTCVPSATAGGGRSAAQAPRLRAGRAEQLRGSARASARTLVLAGSSLLRARIRLRWRARHRCRRGSRAPSRSPGCRAGPSRARPAPCRTRLAPIEHAEVVVRLGQLGEVLRQLREDLDRFVRVLRLGQDDALLEAHLPRSFGLVARKRSARASASPDWPAATRR